MNAATAVEFLLVQDDAVDEIYTREALQAYKVVNRVHAVRDVRQAMAFLDRESPYGDAPVPDIVLLDLNLPGHDGRHLLRHLRTRADTAEVPVMVLVDSPAAERIARREHLPVQGYLLKPVDFSCLATVVQAMPPMAFLVLRRS
jgi:CheY-like chemotaxis protein